MSLPKLNAPEYRLNIPSTDEEITNRPFLVKEEKLLLIAQETGTDKATYDAIKQIIKGCCISGDLNIETIKAELKNIAQENNIEYKLILLKS